VTDKNIILTSTTWNAVEARAQLTLRASSRQNTAGPVTAIQTTCTQRWNSAKAPALLAVQGWQGFRPQQGLPALQRPRPLMLYAEVCSHASWCQHCMLLQRQSVRTRRHRQAWKRTPMAACVESPIPQWWHKWKSDLESVSGTGSPPKFHHF